jgi:hypothetical protein
MAGWLEVAKTAGSYLKNNAGQIASGVAGAVLGNKGGGTSKTSTNVETMPEWMTDYAKNMLQQSAALAGQPYQGYDGAKVAGLTPDEQAANEMVRTNAGQASSVIGNAAGLLDPNAGQGMLSKAGEYLDAADSSWLDPGTSGKWVEDFKSQVNNPAEADTMRVWNQKINPAILANYSGAKGVGQFGRDAMAREQLGAGTDLAAKLFSQNADYLKTAYTTGQSQFNTENTQRGLLSQMAANQAGQAATMNRSAADAQMDAAERYAAANTKDAGLLSQIGTQQRQIEQQAIDADMKEFARAQGWSQEQLNNMLATLKGVQNFTGKSSTTTDSSAANDSWIKNAMRGMSLYNAAVGVGGKETPEEPAPAPAPSTGNGTTAVPESWYNPEPAPKARGGLLRRIASGGHRG